MVKTFDKKDDIVKIDPYSLFQDSYIKENEYIESEAQRKIVTQMQDNVADMLETPEKRHFDSHYIRHYITDMLIKYMAPEDKFDYFRMVSKVYGQKKKSKERRIDFNEPNKKKRRSKEDSRLEGEDDFMD